MTNTKTVSAGNAFSRRSMLFGLAVAPAVALPVVASAANEKPSYPECFSAIDRLQHHLLMAAAAADELAPGQQSRWTVSMFGKAGTFRPSYRVHRIDAFCEPHPRVPTGIVVERSEEIAAWNIEPVTLAEYSALYGIPLVQS